MTHNFTIILLSVRIPYVNRVRLMCALKAHINKSIFGKVLLGIENVVKTFSIPNKLSPKLVYYCVPLISHFTISKVTYSIQFYNIYNILK